MKREATPRLVSTRRDTASKRLLEIHRLGPHPIIEHFLDQIGVARILDKHIHSNREGVLSHGRAIWVLVHNVLVSRDPLYRLTEWAEPIDPQALGLSPEEKLALNDDPMGRALDQLSEYAGRGVFFQLALRCIKLFELETRRIHFDTTTVTVTGEYAESIREPVITHGHNKDHKPHLKQLVFGLNVTADGAVPLSHQVSSGNRTDDTFHRDNFDALRDLLAKHDFIYVADSNLCTKENLKHIHDFGGKFVTVLPQTHKEDAAFRQKLRRKAGRWRHILTVEVPGGHGQVETYSITLGPERTEDGFRHSPGTVCTPSRYIYIDTCQAYRKTIPKVFPCGRIQLDLFHIIAHALIRRRSAPRTRSVRRWRGCPAPQHADRPGTDPGGPGRQ